MKKKAIELATSTMIAESAFAYQVQKNSVAAPAKAPKNQARRTNKSMQSAHTSVPAKPTTCVTSV